MTPCVLDELLIRTCRSWLPPRTKNKPFPGFSGDESLSGFKGGDYRFDVEIGGQVIGIDDGRIEWIRAPQFDLSTCPEGMRGRVRGSAE